MAARRVLQSVNMDSEKRTEIMHKLDTGYHKTCHQTELVVKDEQVRRLKLRAVLLRDDIAALEDELRHKEERIKKLLLQHDAIQDQLHATAEKARQQENQMRSQARELANAKEEMESLVDINKDSAKLRTEKLALTRELDILKPELEHLKSQLAHQKTVLAEKLALERQINALEVELANEKRAAERLQGREKNAEQELRQKLHDLEKQLAKERRAAQKTAQEGQDAVSAEAEQEISELRSQLAKAEKKLMAAEKQRKADAKAAKTKGADNSEALAEELEQLRLELTETQKELAASEKQRKADAKAAKAKGGDHSEAVVEELEQLRSELAETKNELANEKKEKERIRKEGEKALAEAESQRLPLEERIDNLKVKLRETRGLLKECREDLERAQEAAITAATKAATTTKVPTKKAAAAKAAPAKKRRVDEISGPEASILVTPGKEEERPRRTFKKPFAPAAVGEKSTFSITPFLNKTINLSDASLHPITEDEPEEQEETADGTEPAASTDTPSKAVPKKKQPASKSLKGKAALTESSPNMPAPKSRKAPSAESILDKVTEEVEGVAAAEQENQAPAPVVKQKKRMVLKNRTITSEITEPAATPVVAAPPSTTAAPPVPEPKKKKRKLLGGASTSVLFDGAADAEDAPAPAAAPVKAPVKRVSMGKAALGAGGAAKRAVGLGAKNAFAGGSFSPLKRDRRGVSASFLA
ncbi:hypothetical protein GE09DRAFT_1160668 [Coniochaeta sp. 2T2.1]|nr:hypothetical protein GE09DRAFT_1160668 [Coniochaeta sp. 2T2.1]